MSVMTKAMLEPRYRLSPQHGFFYAIVDRIRLAYYSLLIFIYRVILMSGSLPHSIALSGHTLSTNITPGYTTFDVRSDEDTNMAALNARNAKASSDLIVTISEQGQALSQRNHKVADEIREEQNEDDSLIEEEFIEDYLEPIVQASPKDNKTHSYQEKTPTGDFLDQIV
ncbi:hypothetical protein [Marinomonas sp.]|uniref:hypothetical protein n=1 Tax=Marinomonas sp. TaxID=1904862 RepID=UPI003A95ADC5